MTNFTVANGKSTQWLSFPWLTSIKARLELRTRDRMGAQIAVWLKN